MRRFSYLLFLCLLPGTLVAQLSVDTAILRFAPDEKPFRNIVLSNASDEVLFVSSETTIVNNPKDAENPDRVPTKKLLVSPSRFSIEAGGQRTVRLLVTSQPDENQKVYRVRFLPKADNPAKKITKKVAGRSTTLKILTGAGVLLFQDPVESDPKLEFERNENKIRFQNKGNVYVLLFDGKDCKSEDDLENPVNCKELPSNRLYPGADWSVSVGGSTTVSYRKEILGQYEDLLIPPNT